MQINELLESLCNTLTRNVFIATQIAQHACLTNAIQIGWATGIEQAVKKYGLFHAFAAIC